MLYSSSTQLKPAHNWVYIIQQKLIQKSHITLRLLWGKECTKREYKEHFFISFKYLIMWFSLLYTSNCAGKLYKCCIAFQYHCINLGVQSYTNAVIITNNICLQNIFASKTLPAKWLNFITQLRPVHTKKYLFFICWASWYSY